MVAGRHARQIQEGLIACREMSEHISGERSEHR